MIKKYFNSKGGNFNNGKENYLTGEKKRSN